MLGPWTHTVGNRWTRVVKRIPVPPGAKDAIMSIGLMGATGTLDVDGLTVELVPIGGAATTNLIVNGDFELGDPAPAYWSVKDARRVFPGNDSQAALELIPCPVVRHGRRGAAGRPVRGARSLDRGPMLGPARRRRGDGDDLLPGPLRPSRYQPPGQNIGDACSGLVGHLRLAG